MLLPGQHTRRKTGIGICYNKLQKAENQAKSVRKQPKRPSAGLEAGIRLDVQQILAGELGLVRDEGEAGLGLGAHQPFDRIGGALAVFGQ
jgi:hypothetical protein